MLSPTLRAAYQAMLDDLETLDPAAEDLDPEAVASVIADVRLALILGSSVHIGAL